MATKFFKKFAWIEIYITKLQSWKILQTKLKEKLSKNKEKLRKAFNLRIEKLKTNFLSQKKKQKTISMQISGICMQFGSKFSSFPTLFITSDQPQNMELASVFDLFPFGKTEKRKAWKSDFYLILWDFKEKVEGKG